MTTLAPTVQAFFTDYLTRQRRASPHTIAAYRDSLRLLLAFAARQTGKQPSRLEITDLDAPVIGAFLDHLENDRGNGVRTRNARLAAIHALFSFAALRHLECAAVIQRVMAVPPKRFDRKLVTYLTEPEAAALLAAPDTATMAGRRDQAMLALAVQTGLRVSELTSLTRADAFLGTGAHVTCTGKGRKQRITPLTPATAKVLAGWLGERPGEQGDPLFPSRSGAPMSRDAVERRVARHTASAARTQPSLKGKKVSPHVLRHTAAMRLLAAGTDTTVIALWLGHESVATTQIYIHADLAIKEKALARTAPLDVEAGRYQPPDALVEFLESL
ncbi:MAG TPA: tyrosine-type recombinase/integrase [Streptosporangiaceae bacterium]|jgi:site-specific recombinase XerD